MAAFPPSPAQGQPEPEYEDRSCYTGKAPNANLTALLESPKHTHTSPGFLFRSPTVRQEMAPKPEPNSPSAGSAEPFNCLPTISEIAGLPQSEDAEHQATLMKPKRFSHEEVTNRSRRRAKCAKPIKGNNLYGRSGNWRCGECRRRRGKVCNPSQ
jgi:hypothetical protein